MITPGRRLLVIWNSHSGGGGYKRDEPLIVGALRGLGYDVEERPTQSPGDACHGYVSGHALPGVSARR